MSEGKKTSKLAVKKWLIKFPHISFSGKKITKNVCVERRMMNRMRILFNDIYIR